MTTALPTGKPPYAVTMWADDHSVYVELPSARQGEPPYILRYAKSEAGLSKALWLMHDAYEKSKPLKPIDFTKDPRVKLAKGTTGYTDDQREAARAVMRRMGII